MKKLNIIQVICCLLIFSCNNKPPVTMQGEADILHKNERNLTGLIIYDIFSPPVASRIYAYTSLAAYEAIRHSDTNSSSITENLNLFSPMPLPERDKKYNYTLAASKAFYTVARQMTFSKDTLSKFEDEVYEMYKKSLDKDVYNNSLSFGEQVAKVIMQRAALDNYKETRAMEKYFGSEQDGKWRPTAPDYLDGVEPYWAKIKAMSLDSSSQFDPGQPPPFSKDTASTFFKMNREVFETINNLSKEQQDIAYFWDDNPFVSHHKGHLMYNTKKQTPGGHWMGITTIACLMTNANVVKTAKAYALVAVGLLDGFISCWNTKYKYQYVRPITIINDWFEKKWEPYLQTPPFPEYTSGHSTISASAATVLTALFGDNFAFHDDADKEYIGMERNFISFQQAAQEASISRLYGGIHYLISLDKGNENGKKIGELIINKLGL